ncbi:hypothetical protein H5410_028096 [Solanum commersonii]|uniref:Uncharacterized protein n=1 Tax=Solanum commersonii TaxID=4109 RepID=A0A9J5Z586_SOLCO|nr:hypothetical protein H5410_028096 [Solanum commersonii]
MESIKPPLEECTNDVAWWMGSTQGIFIVKSAWELMRHKQERRTGIHMENMHLQQLIITWWKQNDNAKLKVNGETTTYNEMVMQVQEDVRKLIKLKYPWIHIKKET